MSNQIYMSLFCVNLICHSWLIVEKYIPKFFWLPSSNFLLIIVSSPKFKILDPPMQVKRAKKALNNLLTSINVDDKETNHDSWTFGRRGPATNRDRTGGNFRSISQTFAKSWSASKQIQAISSNLQAPRGGEPTGLALPVYIMSMVLVFVMWALVAAIPCQERAGLGAHFQVSNLGPVHL